jgi:hypothetical protein
MSAQAFADQAARAQALSVFLGRGYRLVRSRAPWPGEIRLVDADILEWRPIDQDPAEPLWERLRELHAIAESSGGHPLEDGPPIGLAIVLLEAGTTPHGVVAALEQVCFGGRRGHS